MADPKKDKKQEPILARKETGRPSKLTEEIAQKIVNCIRAGAYIETAVAFAGVSRPVFYVWMKRGREQPVGKYQRFVSAVEEALAAAMMRDLLVIDKAAEAGDWRASAWRLERRHPKEWGAKRIVEVKSNDKSVQFVMFGAGKIDDDDQWAKEASEEAQKLTEERKKNATRTLTEELEKEKNKLW